MAGEWLAYDLALPQKPEVLELVDATGLDTDQVVGRMLMLWGWASLNCEDGQARIPLRLLGRGVGAGDADFWRAVQAVGWLEIDEEAGTVAIPGWDRRFSKTAKSRALETVRNRAANVKKEASTRPARKSTRAARNSTRAARGDNARGASEREEREERSSSSSSSPPESAAPGAPEPDPSWEALLKSWRLGPGRPWQLPDPPDGAAERLQEAGWFDRAMAAIRHLPKCRFFRDPVTLPQFVAPGFVDKILGGQFDNARHASGGGGFRPDERPPAQGWTGDDLAALEATRKALAGRLKEAV